MSINSGLLLAMAWGAFPRKRRKKQEDELNMYLRINKTTLEKEVELIKQKRSGLSARLRDVAIYRYEQNNGEPKE